MIFDGDKFSLERIMPAAPPLAGIGDPSLFGFFGFSGPRPESPRNTKIRKQFWKQRADRRSSEITSGDATIDAQRNKIRDIIYSDPTVSGAAAAPLLRKLDGTTYRPSTFIRKGKSLSTRVNVFTENKTYGFDLK